jgi:peptidoglycan/LPS O-acetylase OafA/YrhL
MDGLRAGAVAVVVLGNAGVGGLAGGFLGIEVFFVLTGFLLTSLLLAERRMRGHVDIVRFWAARARRALPALLTVVGGVSITVLALQPGELQRLGPEVRAAVTGLSNWHLIARSSAAQTAPAALDHLWSVAVGAQFVVWWPLMFALLAPRLGRRRLRATVLLLAVASAIAMGVLSLLADPARALYGTDARASGLLIGAGVALAFRPSAWHVRASGARARRLRLFGLIMLAGLGAVISVATPRSVWVPRGGVLLVAVLTAVLIAAVLRSAEFDRLLGAIPLRWLGLRAYAVFLWHWPLLLLFGGRSGVARPERLALYLAVTIALAYLTHRFVERPLCRTRAGRGPGRVGRPSLAVQATAVACGAATVAALLTGQR